MKKLPSRNDWQKYSAIKVLVEDYCQMQEGRRYEDFMRKLLQILDL